MSFAYEVGYGTCEESAYAQLFHDTQFTQSQYEKIVQDAIVKAAIKCRDLSIERWEVNEEAGYLDDEDDIVSDAEIKSGRQNDLERAMEYRLKGEEYMYLHCLQDAYIMPTLRLTYQDLHDDVVKILCNEYGFRPVEFLRSVSLFGWANLAIKDDWESYVGKESFTQRVSRTIRRLVWKEDGGRFGSASAGAKWIASRKRAIDKNPTGCDKMDEDLCKELGVEFIASNDSRIQKSEKKELQLSYDEKAFLKAFELEQTQDND